MGIESRDEMVKLIGECVEASFREFTLDLERRIAIRLLQIQAFKPPVRTAIAQEVSKAVGEMLTMTTFNSGVVEDKLASLL